MNNKGRIYNCEACGKHHEDVELVTINNRVYRKETSGSLIVYYICPIKQDDVFIEKQDFDVDYVEYKDNNN